MLNFLPFVYFSHQISHFSYFFALFLFPPITFPAFLYSFSFFILVSIFLPYDFSYYWLLYHL